MNIRTISLRLKLLVISALAIPLACASAQNMTWDAGGGADLSWSNTNNWNPNGSPAGGNLTFTAAGATANSTTVSNLVDANTTAGILAYTANSTLWQVTSISSGVTLNIDGSIAPSDSNLLRVGRRSTTLNATTQVSISGAGKLEINNNSYNIWVNNTTSQTGATGLAVLDLSGLSVFSASVNQLAVGAAVNSSSNATFGQGIMYLAGTNTITANTVVVGSSETGGGYNASGTNNLASALYLGASNTIYADSISVGAGTTGYGSRSSGVVQFQNAGSSVTIRGTNGTSSANLTIGGGDAYVGGASTSSSVSFIGGTVDALFSTLVIAKANAGNNITGSLSMDQGTISAGTVYAGWSLGSGNNGQQLNATINVAGGSFTANTLIMSRQESTATQVANSFLNVSGTGLVDIAGDVTVGYAGNSNSNVYATINVTGGEMRVGGNISESGTMSRVTSTITLAGGTLDLTDGTITNLTNFNLQSGTLKNVAQYNAGADIAKTTSGILVFEGTNAFTGNTTVSAGTLLVNGSLTNSKVIVQSGGTLGGSGVISQSVSVAAGGSLAPGNSPGILQTGSVSLASGADLTMEINGATAGTQYDQLLVNGTVNLNSDSGIGADLVLSLGFAPSTVGQTFTLINNDSTDAIAGAFATINGAAFGPGNTFELIYNTAVFGFQLSYAGGDGNDLVMTVSAIPEPSTMVLAALALTATVIFRRRRTCSK